MSALLHISDTHFGTERATVVEALVRLCHRLQPTLVVLSGDITQRARRHQFAAARALMDRLNRPYLVIPGNHDIALFDLWSRLRHPYGYHLQAFGPTLEPVWQSAQWLVIGVNTTRWWRHKNGELSPGQIERVARLLRTAAPGQRRVVVTHQPMLVIKDADQRNLLRGHALAAARWAEAGADVLLGGHIHLPYMRPLRQALPAIVRDVLVLQAGTAVSQRLRADISNSVNVLHSDDHPLGCRAERWDYRDREDDFVRVEQCTWSMDRPS
ncbi:MAG: metallophosphoesterase [Dyella sp.]